jgi:hypothetical protein
MKSINIGQISKSKSQMIMINNCTLDSENAIDIRIFFDKSGEWLPTKKGVFIKDSYWSEIEKYICATEPKSMNTSFDLGRDGERLGINFVDDRYGQGIDMRIFYSHHNEWKHSPKGTRFKYPDQWNELLSLFDGREKNIEDSSNEEEQILPPSISNDALLNFLLN